jgi:uncharacterized repeat protein (TIGR03803 family)
MRYDPRYPKKEQMYHPAEESPMRMTSRFVGAILFGVLIFAATALTCAQTFQVIHTFHDADGATPLAGLTLDAAGNLYGTTVHGGNNELGVVFKLSRSGSSWVITPLYKFTGGSDGYNPASRVIFGPDGPLYGSAYEGGAGGWGTVFRLQPSPTRPRTALNTWNETTLYAFQGGSDGAIPWFDLVFRPGGSIYGTTTEGDQGSCGGNGCGTVYQLTGSGNNWTRNLLYAFAGDDDGGFPQGIIFDSAGNIFGTTDIGGGPANHGTVFELSPSGSGWTENIIYRFQAGDDGSNPLSGLIMDSAANLYGSSTCAGQNGGGAIFELTPFNGNWTLNVLYSLTGICNSGPRGELLMDGTGNLYGTTYTGGIFSFGSVFKLSPGDGGWTYTSLHDFTGGSDGAMPEGRLIFDSNGNLYGTASQGGTGCSSLGCGVVFEITP